jgi:hypothetical protein
MYWNAVKLQKNESGNGSIWNKFYIKFILINIYSKYYNFRSRFSEVLSQSGTQIKRPNMLYLFPVSCGPNIGPSANGKKFFSQFHGGKFPIAW